ncbi:hypothetical protein ES703_26071 [subsurface metagenome]
MIRCVKMRRELTKMQPSKPDVYCPKEKKRVPIWWCLGSFVQGKEQCPELIEAKVDFGENRAEVRCKARGEKHPTHDKLPSCFGGYDENDPLCRLECWWKRACKDRETQRGIVAPLRDDQYPSKKVE